MYRIAKKKTLNSTVTQMNIEAPYVAAKAQAGQFIILRVHKDGERIPLTIAGYDRTAGTVRIIFQVVGATTMLLNAKNEGEYIEDFVGPLGNATDLGGVKKALVLGGGVGSAIALPIAQALKKNGCAVTSVVGFRNKDLVILKEDFQEASERFILMTDDGSAGRKGLVTEPLREILEKEKDIDKIFIIGPLVMMKFAVECARPFGVPTVVSMNPIMIDGTGMCGCCRLTVGGKMLFACVDGPDFDGCLVNFDEAISRSAQYAEFERKAREKTCNLLKKGC